MYTLAQIRKALVGGAGAGLFAGALKLGDALADGSLTASETGIAAGAALTAFAGVGLAVFKVRNARSTAGRKGAA